MLNSVPELKSDHIRHIGPNRFSADNTTLTYFTLTVFLSIQTLDESKIQMKFRYHSLINGGSLLVSHNLCVC